MSKMHGTGTSPVGFLLVGDVPTRSADLRTPPRHRKCGNVSKKLRGGGGVGIAEHFHCFENSEDATGNDV